MIVKLIPEQIVKLWDSIRLGIISAIAPIVDPTPDNMQNILCQLLKQDMQCWCIFDEDENIYGYIVTSISIDINTDFRTLIVYSMYFYNMSTEVMWQESYKAIEKFAEVNKCTRITAYSANPRAIELAESYGFNKNYTYLVKDI